MTGITAQALAMLLVEAHDRGERCSPQVQQVLQETMTDDGCRRDSGADSGAQRACKRDTLPKTTKRDSGADSA